MYIDGFIHVGYIKLMHVRICLPLLIHCVREGQILFADFVRKGGGGGTPQIRNLLFAEKKSVKGGGREVPPKSVTYFLDQNQVFFEQKTPFLALFEENFSGKNP